MREITYLEAVREAMTQEMERDSRVFLIGEDIGEYGGAFQVSHGMLEKFGHERILDTPIAELGLTGAAVGGIAQYVTDRAGLRTPQTDHHRRVGDR